MKTKGITFWEQHVEHIALGLAGVAFVGLAAMQFIGNPNAVEVNGKQVGPGEVDELLREHAREIQAMIDPTAEPPQMEKPKGTIESFQAKLTGSVSPKPTLWVSGPRVSPVTGETVDPAGGAFVQAEIAAPTDVRAQGYIDTVQPETVSAIGELKDLLPKEPYDIIWTTVAGKFDVAKPRKDWSTDRDGARALPPSWIEEGPYLVDVILEREELVDANAFGNLTTVNVMPGRLTFRQQLASAVDGTIRDEVLGTLDEPASANEIVQPEFYPCLADAWAPPGAVVQQVVDDANPALAELAKLKSMLGRLTTERDRLLEKMKENQCSETEPVDEDKDKKKEPPTKVGGGGNSGGGGVAPPDAGGGPSGAAGGGRGFREPPGAKENESKCKEMRNKLKRLRTRIEKLEQKIAELQPPQPEQPKEAQPKEEERKDVIDIWAHDIWVEAGKTYRYRLTVKIYNPLFGRKLDLSPEQQPLAEQFTLSSETSEWSEPITVEPALRVFVVDANPRSNLGALGALPFGQASAEVYRYFGGRWWSETATVRPGDQIGGADSRARRPGGSPAIDFASEWFLLDVVESVNSDVVVVLQNLNSPLSTVFRSPKDDAKHPDRSWLRDAVAEANLAAPLAVK